MDDDEITDLHYIIAHVVDEHLNVLIEQLWSEVRATQDAL